MLLGKGVLKICSKFTGEHPCRIAISIKLQSKATLLNSHISIGCLSVNLLLIFKTPFFKKTTGRLLLLAICCANQLTSFYIRATLPLNGLIITSVLAISNI